MDKARIIYSLKIGGDIVKSTENIIELNSWSIVKDNLGSDYEIIDNEIIAAKLKKAKQTDDNLTYINIRMHLDNHFEEKYFKIPRTKGFRITYKNTHDNDIVFIIEQNLNTYFYYRLPPSREWTTEIIKINYMQNDDDKLKLDLKNITSFIFSLNSFYKKEITDTVYIKEFVILNYEIISLKMHNSNICKKYLIKKSIFNSIKSSFLMDKKKKYSVYNSQGNPLYCIYPFYQFLINRDFYSVCCWTSLDTDTNFIDNRNLLDIWYGDKFEKMRKCIKDLSYSECNLNDCTEVLNNSNILKTLDELRIEYPYIADYIEGKFEKYKIPPKDVYISYDNVCNLRCRSCTVPDQELNSLKNNQKYKREIEKIGNSVEKLLISGHGEAFASPVYRDWLFNFPAKKFTKLKKFEILSNGILWTKENWNRISSYIKKQYIEASISIDGATKEVYEYNRGGAKFETLVENIKNISELRKKNKLKYLKLNCVIQQNNYKEIPLIVDFAKKYLFDKIVFWKIRNWGTYNNKEFIKIDVFNKKHPEHKNIKKIYKKIKQQSEIEDIVIEFSFKL